MNKEDLDIELEKLSFTKEEEFKCRQTNELIQLIDKLRIALNGR